MSSRCRQRATTQKSEHGEKHAGLGIRMFDKKQFRGGAWQWCASRTRSKETRHHVLTSSTNNNFRTLFSDGRFNMIFLRFLTFFQLSVSSCSSTPLCIHSSTPLVCFPQPHLHFGYLFLFLQESPFLLAIFCFVLETTRTSAMRVIHVIVKTEETQRLRIEFVLQCTT